MSKENVFEQEPLIGSLSSETIESVDVTKKCYSYGFRLATACPREIDVTVHQHQVVVIGSKNERQGSHNHDHSTLPPLSLSCSLPIPDDAALDTVKVLIDRDNLSVTLERDTDLRVPGRTLFVQAD
jgi:hypothetical protein